MTLNWNKQSFGVKFTREKNFPQEYTNEKEK